jgi:GAF domain-containing protein
VVPCESASVLLEEAGGQLRFAAVAGPSEAKLKGSVLPHRAGIAGFSIAWSTGVIVRRTSSDPRFYREVDRVTGYNTRSVLCVPLGQKGACFGCLQLLNPPSGHRFEPDDLRLAQEVGEALTTRLVRQRPQG